MLRQRVGVWPGTDGQAAEAAMEGAAGGRTARSESVCTAPGALAEDGFWMGGEGDAGGSSCDTGFCFRVFVLAIRTET